MIKNSHLKPEMTKIEKKWTNAWQKTVINIAIFTQL